MSGPSEKAVEAAYHARPSDTIGTTYTPAGHRLAATEAAVRAAHDPALGLDRSVCLRDVVEALQREGWLDLAVRILVRDFGSGS